MSSATLTPLVRHLRNPAGVIQANLRDQTSGFSDQPVSPGQIRSARVGYPGALREKYHSMARLQGAQEEPDCHGRPLVKRDHAMISRDPAIPGQQPSPEGVVGIIGIHSEDVAAVTADLMQISGNHRPVQQGCVGTDKDQVTRHGDTPIGGDGRV